jgi:outer membrane protein
LGSLEYTPFTLVAQYRFSSAKSPFRPYLSAGLTYGSVDKERGSAQLTSLTNTGSTTPTTFTGDSQFGVTVGVGATFAFNERWFVDAAFSKTFLKSKVLFSTGQTVNLKLDPLATRVAIGYRF